MAQPFVSPYKVTKLKPSEVHQTVMVFQGLVTAGKYEEAADHMWIIQTILEKTEINITLRSKVSAWGYKIT